MSEELVVRHCAPTLAGIKTGNLFSCEYEDEHQVKEYIRKLNRLLLSKGIRVLPLRYKDNRALVYLYRPRRLKQDFVNLQAEQILRTYGYPFNKPEQCIVRLVERLRNCEEFPHEIGLFLGYPPDDVLGFIQNGGVGCKCVGCWKVYGDAEAAQRCFMQYKKCTDIYCARWLGGKSIERLTVAA